MADQKRIDFLSQVWGLFNTIQEGITYLVQHPKNTGVRADIAAGAHALDAHYQSMMPKKTEVRGGGIILLTQSLRLRRTLKIRL